MLAVIGGFWLAMAVAWAGPDAAVEPDPVQVPASTLRFDNAQLHTVVERLLGAEAAAAARQAPNVWEFELEGHSVMVITDEAADRMRIMVPIAPVDQLPPGLERRMLQANFDAVLDARYAIARDTVWSVFIHPLSLLTVEELGSGLAQTITAAATFGGAFTSGALVFGGGDSSSLHRALYNKVLEQLGLDQGI